MPVWTLRTASAADAEFLCCVYASTRLEELQATGWHAGQIEAFLRMQFTAQDLHYRRQHPLARFDIVQAYGEDIGRLYVERSEEIRVLDIALLPAYRRRGLGTSILRALLVEACAANRCVGLHVERRNPAANLYRKLGFVPVTDDGVYCQMRWQPSAGDAVAAVPMQEGEPAAA